MTKEQELFERLDAFSRKYSELIKNTNEETGRIKYRFVVLSLPADFPNTPLSDELLISLVQKNKELYEIEKSIRTIFFTPFADDPEMMTKWKADHGDAEPPEIYIPKPEFFADPESLLSFVLNSIYRPYRSPEETEIINAARFLSGFLYAFTDLLAGTVRSEEVQREQLELIQNSWDKLIEYIDADLQDFEKLYKDHPEGLPEIYVNTVSPLEHISTIDKASQTAFDLLKNTLLYSPVPVNLSVENKRRKAKKEINVSISLSYDELSETGVIERLTPFDKEVHDAIITRLTEGGSSVMTNEMIYRAMTGRPNARLMPVMDDLITQSIRKMMKTLVVFDTSEEAAALGFESLQYEGNLITADRITAVINNNTVNAIRLIQEPVLYVYANRTDRIGRVETKILNSPLNKTEENIILQGYLKQRILPMKNKRSAVSNTIRYDAIYERLGVPEEGNRDKKADIRRKTKTILEYWKKEGFITDFEEERKGKRPYGVNIDPQQIKPSADNENSTTA